MTKKQRSVLLSVVTLVLCLALVAAGTYALFSDRVTLGNHLVAGKLDITLVRTNLTTTSLNPNTGFLVNTENNEDIDFSIPWDDAHPERKNKNVFDMTDETLIVPGSSYTAEMKIANNIDIDNDGQVDHESNVAFGYWLEIVFEDDPDLDMTLANQILITVTTVDGTKSITGEKLSESEGKIGDEDDVIGILALGGENIFTVTITFSDLDTNNDAMSKTFKFDLVVHAIQITTAP